MYVQLTEKYVISLDLANVWKGPSKQPKDCINSWHSKSVSGQTWRLDAKLPDVTEVKKQVRDLVTC